MFTLNILKTMQITILPFRVGLTGFTGTVIVVLLVASITLQTASGLSITFAIGFKQDGNCMSDFMFRGVDGTVNFI